MKKVMSLLLALLMVLGLLTTTAWADLPEGTGPMFFYDDKQEEYYNGTRIDRGETKVFSKVYYSNDPDYIEITGGDVTTTTSGLKASLTDGALTVQADTDCTLGEQFVIVTTDGSAKYAMRFNVSEGGGGQGGPPFAGTVRNFITKNFTEAQGVWSTAQEASAIAAEWGNFDNEAHRFALEQYPWLGQVLSDIGIAVPVTRTYKLSADTAIDITVPECLSGIVILPDALAPNNVLTVKFKDGVTAEDWKNVYNGSMMRDFAMLSYTFRYIGEMKNPKYYTWNAQNGDSVAAAAAKAAEKCSYGYDRGISNAIVVAKFQDDGEMMVLPGNTNVNATSHEIISWEGTGGYSYLTDVVDTSNVSAMMLDIKQSADYGTQRNWLDKLGSPTDSSRVSLPQVDGVTMTVNKGLVRTAFDTTKTMNVEQVLAAAVSITAPDGAVQYRIVNNYTSTEPNASPDAGSTWEVNSMKKWLGDAEWKNVNGAIALKPNTLKEQKVGNVSYYIGENITGVHCTVIEWKMGDESTKTEYIYFNAAPYVRNITQESVAAILAPVEAPTAVSEDSFTLNCRIFPQDNDGACYFRLSIWKEGSQVTTFDGGTTYTVYVPYEYIDYTWEQAQQTTARPEIGHYDDLHNLKETIVGEYTPYGVKFETRSFSPFTVSVGKETPTPHHHSSAAPTISAPDTADAGIALYGVMSVMSLMGIGYISGRKKR